MKIAISGKSGCGNSTVTRLVAERLGFRAVNYTFKNMAEELGVPFEQMAEMAEHDLKWDRKLDETQVALARDGNTVLGSRLAIWVLDDADLRVYLDAPAPVRAQRIMKRPGEGDDFDAVLAQMRERDRRDHDRYLRLYGIDNDRYEFADMIIETTDLSPTEVADLIVARARSFAPG